MEIPAFLGCVRSCEGQFRPEIVIHRMAYFPNSIVSEGESPLTDKSTSYYVPLER